MVNKSYKHWVLIFLMCCLSASSIGLCTNSVGVFYTPVSDSLQVLRGTFALHATLSSLATAVTSLFMAKAMHTYRYKRILIMGIVLTVLSTVLMAYSESVYLFYLLGVIRGVGVGIYGMVPLTIIITNWFVKKHGLAISIALSFSGLSGAIFSPLLSAWIQQYGWQTTYLLMAVCILVLTLPAIVYPWHVNPKQSQVLPYGYTKITTKTSTTIKSKFNYITISFFCLSIFTILHTAITGISQHMSGLATSIGHTATIGARMMSLTMIGNILTKLLIGVISDLFNPIKACLIMILMNIASLVLLFVGMISRNVYVLMLSAFLFGSIYAVGAVGIPLLTKYFFGKDKYSQAYSGIGFLTNVGSSLSLTLIGYLYDYTGTYRYVAIIAIGFHLVNCVLLMVVYKRHRS